MRGNDFIQILHSDDKEETNVKQMTGKRRCSQK